MCEGTVKGKGCCHTAVRLNLYTGLHYNLVQSDHFGTCPEKFKLAYKNSRWAYDFVIILGHQRAMATMKGGSGSVIKSTDCKT